MMSTEDRDRNDGQERADGRMRRLSPQSEQRWLRAFEADREKRVREGRPTRPMPLRIAKLKLAKITASQ